MNIVIVESAAKAKTINKYLGPDYKVIASYGHVRDLPPKDGSVRPDHNFDMVWEVEGSSQKVISDIAKAVKGADRLILATDPDREGEAISWHLLQILKEKKALKDGVPVERVAFNAVTKDAILKALANPRKIDEPLVDAYLARRALDYLVGFTLSPVLWRKLPGARSAGRVQSVALRLVCDRETEIEAFKTREYWSVTAALEKSPGEEFQARLAGREGKKLDRFDISNEEIAHRYRDAIRGQAFTVESIEAKDHKRHPAPPFTTSTLQQEASRKLGFSPRQTMQIAQRLYEGVDIGGETVGLITYMRTDGVQIVPEAVAQARGAIESAFGKRYLPNAPRIYKTKAKNAQEAHEAVRPTDFRRHPDKLRLQPDQARLYKLIWQRAVASQMASADIERTTVEISVRGKDGVPYGLRATGSVVLFDGFLKLYEEGQDDSAGDEDGRLPKLAPRDGLTDRGVEAKQHFTEPPPRFTEATLIREMEKLGIGRPSTYAATVNVLRERDYVSLDKKRLLPQDKGRLVTAFLESFFKTYVEYDFTADLEEKLDLISDGKLDWRQVLRDFWLNFIAAVDDIKDLRVGQVLEALNEILGPHIFPQAADGGDPRVCPVCGTGQLSLKVGKFGAFVGCSNYPECRYTRQFKSDEEGAIQVAGENGSLGTDPGTGQPVYMKSGRFGPYIQLGEGENGDKPKRASIPSGVEAASVTLEYALKLLSLPREVGTHPESGKPITAGFGRYGPYVEHDGKYVKIDADEVFTIGLNRAVTVIAEGAGKGGRQRAAQTVLKSLGDHPQLGGKVEVLSGRYGPYIKHSKTNATLPKEMNPEALTMDEAVRLLEAKASQNGKAKPGGRTKAAAKGKANGEPKAEAAPKKAAAKAAGSKKASAKAASSESGGEGKPAKPAKKARTKSAPGDALV